jgi:hypothetical protein
MKTAVEWLIDEIDMQYPDINIKRKEWMIDKAKEMEEDARHESYLDGHTVGFTKAMEKLQNIETKQQKQ